MNANTILLAAYGLLGDGGGREWGDNPEYTRAICELIGDTVGVPEELVDRGTETFEPFIFGMLYAAHILNKAKEGKGP